MANLEQRYQEIFRLTPVGLWEEDWGKVLAALDELKAQGVTDFVGYFADNPSEVFRLAALVQITDINDYTWQLFEARDKQEMLTSLSEVFDEESFPVFMQQMVAFAVGETVVESEAYARTFKGNRLHVHMVLRRLEPAEGRVPVLLCMIDISKRKQVELQLAQVNLELKRSNEELEQFAYVASHDLQEPLRMVASYSQLLEKRYAAQLDERARKYISYSVDGAKRMQALIADLLRLSRIGMQGKVFEPVSVNDVVDRVITDLSITIGDVGGRVTRDELPSVSADDIQMGQLFQNLISNGLKFRRPDIVPEVQVSVSRDGDDWHFRIQDNGIGIDAEHLENVFVIFQRLHKRGEYEGTGIGLSAAKKIVERHGGRIWIESIVGEGSTFHFTLPALKE